MRYANTLGFLMLGTTATMEHWLLYRLGCASTGSVWFMGMMYAVLAGVLFAQDSATIRAMEAAREAMQLYAEIVKSLDAQCTELKKRCSSES